MTAEQFTVDISSSDQMVDIGIAVPDAESDLSDYDFQQRVELA
mgnify:CR=1 FL=1